MAAPTWATDPLGKALQLIGYHPTHAARLFNRSLRDVKPQTDNAVALTSDWLPPDATQTWAEVDDGSGLPTAPFFALLSGGATFDTIDEWDIADEPLSGLDAPIAVQPSVSTGFAYWTDAGGATPIAEPDWGTVEGEKTFVGAAADKWAADTVTAVGDEVVPAYDDWAPDTVTTLGTKVYPTTPDGYFYECTARAGDFKTHGATEPVWPGVVGATVVDDQVTWTCRQPLVAVCTARDGDFKTHAATEPTWPAVGETVVDDQVTWKVRKIEWTAFIPAESELVKVTDVTDETLTIERIARGLPLHGTGTMVQPGPKQMGLFVSGAELTPLGIQVTIAAAEDETPAHTPDDDGATLGNLLYKYCGLSKSVGKRVYAAATKADYSLTITVED